MTRSSVWLIALLAMVAITRPQAALAAESYDNCTGFITSLPTTVTTQGTWCLKQDLNTAIASGNAITVNTNNVTIDCNGYKLGGLSAGAGTGAVGIFAQDRVNVTVRHCAIRGFFVGVDLYGAAGGGHLVEDNRFDSNTYLGMQVQGDGSVVRRNLVYATGGTTQASYAMGILVVYSTDVIDNTVAGVTAPVGSNGQALGIVVGSQPADLRVVGNRVRGLAADGSATIEGIVNQSTGRSTIRGNDIVGNAGTGSVGLACANNSSQARDNIIAGFATGISTCSVDSSNYVGP